MMSPLLMVVTIGVLMLGGCRNAAEPSPCRKAALSATSEATSDWRTRIVARTESMAADSTLEVAIFLASQATSEDSAVVEDMGGRITYSFRGFDAFAVDISAGSLRTFAQGPPYARFVNVEIAAPTYMLGCE